MSWFKGTLAVSLAVAAISTALAATDPIQRILESGDTAIDLNGDGKPDLKREFGADGRMNRYELDRNGDGKVDERFERDEETGVTVTRHERETITRHYDGDRLVLEIVETDRNGDGKPDLRVQRAFLPEQDRISELVQKDDAYDGKFVDAELKIYRLRASSGP